MVVAILHDRTQTVAKLIRETGYETVSDILIRLKQRLNLIIPWDKGMENIYLRVL